LIYQFESYRLDPDRRELWRGGELLGPEPQVFDLLHYLICNRDRVVSKDDLIAGVWDGRIVSESTLSSRLTAVRHAVGDSGEQQRLVRTIPRKGFRFVGDVTEQTAGPDRARMQAERGLSLPDKPSIAVLPFRNLSDDPAQDYFVDGIVEDITTALSQFGQLFVVARSSSFTYKGRNTDVQQVGRQLGVRYVLEGSLRKAAGQVRISVQLIDAGTGVQLWAAGFDGALDQVFDLQDRVASGVVGVIAPKIEQVEIERAKRKPTESLDAYDYYLHGLASFHQDSREANDEALRLFGKAVERDPGFAAAYGMAALCFVGRNWKNWMRDPREEVAQAARLANRAAELGRGDAVALAAAGMALGIVVKELDRAAILLDRSLLLNPNLAASWLRSAWVRLFLGQFDLAIEHAGRAMRLSPLDPLLVGMQTAIAFAHFCAGRHDQAAAWAERAVTEQATFAPAIRVLAASCASLDRMDEATKAMARLQEINASVPTDLRHLPFREPKYLAKYAEALRKAGLAD
jgi:TolB-like protein